MDELGETPANIDKKARGESFSQDTVPKKLEAFFTGIDKAGEKATRLLEEISIYLMINSYTDRLRMTSGLVKILSKILPLPSTKEDQFISQSLKEIEGEFDKSLARLVTENIGIAHKDNSPQVKAQWARWVCATVAQQLTGDIKATKHSYQAESLGLTARRAILYGADITKKFEPPISHDWLSDLSRDMMHGEDPKVLKEKFKIYEENPPREIPSSLSNP